MGFKNELMDKAYIRIVNASAEVAKVIGQTCGACVKKHDEFFNTLGGCCSGCSRSNGYLPADYSPEEVAEKKKKYKWTKTKGFLGPTGCKLPRHERSLICLHFVCTKAFTRHSSQITHHQKEVNSAYTDWLKAKRGVTA